MRSPPSEGQNVWLHILSDSQRSTLIWTANYIFTSKKIHAHFLTVDYILSKSCPFIFSIVRMSYWFFCTITFPSGIYILSKKERTLLKCIWKYPSILSALQMSYSRDKLILLCTFVTKRSEDSTFVPCRFMHYTFYYLMQVATSVSVKGPKQAIRRIEPPTSSFRLLKRVVLQNNVILKIHSDIKSLHW